MIEHDCHSVPLPGLFLSCLQKLPADLLNALDLQHIVAQQRSAELAPTPQSQFLSERVRAVAHNHSSSLDPDICSRMIARELVRLAVSSACKRLGLNAHNHLHAATFMELNWERASTATSSLNGESRFAYSKYRESKRVSTVSIMSTDSEPPRKESVASQQNGNGIGFNNHLSLDPKRRPRRLPITTGRPIEVIVQMEDDEELRLTAKKLIKKVLHAACKQWESLYRRSSIEYLIASTKRMRIATSPSPPPPLLEESGTSSTRTATEPPKVQLEYLREDSPAPCKGTKRARSGSHEVYMQKQLEEFRATQLHQKLLEATENTYSRSRKILTVARASSSTLQHQPPISFEGQRLHPDDSVTVLISNIGRMSIAEAETESETPSEEGSDEECTILSAVTKTALFANDDNSKESVSRPVSSPTIHTGPVIGSTTNSMQNGMGASNPTNDIPFTANSPVEPTGFGETCSVVPGMDYYVVVHTHPPPGLCQKFLCSNRDEINILYHCWLFPDVPFDRSVTRSEMLEMGVFEPSGVQSVHQELQDAGVPFHYLDKRYYTFLILLLHAIPISWVMQEKVEQ